MQVEAVPLTDFVHGGLSARGGHPVLMDESLAVDLERAGLVRIKLSPIVAKMQAYAGKEPDDGGGQPSSASPVAQASATTTSPVSARGRGRPRKTDT